MAVWDLVDGTGRCSDIWCRVFRMADAGATLESWIGLLRDADARQVRARVAALRAAPAETVGDGSERPADRGAPAPAATVPDGLPLPPTLTDAAPPPAEPGAADGEAPAPLPRSEARATLDVRPAGRGQPWLQLRLEVLQRDARGRAVLLMTTFTDATAQHAAGDRQRVSAQLFAHLHEGLVITDLQYRVIEANPAYCEITGLARADLVGQVPPWLRPPPSGNAPPDRLSGLREALHRHGRWQGEVVDRRRNGDPCALRVTLSAVRGASGHAKYLMLAVSDVTEPWRQRDQIERATDYDALTQLPNRTSLMRLLERARSAADRDGFLLAVCHVDLDHFKALNARLGVAGGDRLIVEIAGRLRNALRSWPHGADTVARIGGDEFVLLLRGGSIEECRQAVERVLRVIGEPCLADPAREPESVSASIGATLYPIDRADAETLLRHADHALYDAKQAGRAGCVFFDPEQQRRTRARVLALGRVEEALAGGELRLHYQPKVDMASGKVLGVEALLRWQHPEQGLVPPGQFLPLIEPTSLGVRVDRWVLATAVAQLAAWRQAGLSLSVSVNVSARHLQAPDFAPHLEQLLAAHPPELARGLELEVLETAALADVDSIGELMQRCRDSGVRFSLDDFGTGYSNLAYLKRLPIDVLKIDRSFVHGMLADRHDQAIVEGVIALATSFGCGVVAEGVESVEQARRLLDIGCTWGQGWGIAAPMPADEVPDFVTAHRAMLAGPQRVAL